MALRWTTRQRSRHASQFAYIDDAVPHDAQHVPAPCVLPSLHGVRNNEDASDVCVARSQQRSRVHHWTWRPLGSFADMRRKKGHT